MAKRLQFWKRFEQRLRTCASASGKRAIMYFLDYDKSAGVMRRRLQSYDPIKRKRAQMYLLGIVGWVLLALNYPFGWALPTYAGY